MHTNQFYVNIIDFGEGIEDAEAAVESTDASIPAEEAVTTSEADGRSVPLELRVHTVSNNLKVSHPSSCWRRCMH